MKQPLKQHLGIRASVSDSSVLELYILDYLMDGWTYNWVTDEYSETNWVADVIAKVKAANPSRIRITIDSLGGDALVGLSLYNFLKNCDAKVEVDIIGMCASAATLPAMAASKGKLKMARNSFMIIHEAWLPYASGRAKDLREFADATDRITRQYADIYAAKTGMTVEAVLALIEPGDYWMTGTEAVAQGFADEIYNDVPQGSAPVAAQVRLPESFAAAGFRNTPPTLTAPAAAVPPVPQEQNDPQPGATSSADPAHPTSLFMNLKAKAAEFLAKFKKQPVNAQATNLADEVAAAMGEPLTEMIGALQEEMDTEISTVSASVSALETKFNARFTELESANAVLKTENAELKTEISAKIGGATQAASGTEAETKAPIGRFSKGE